MMVQGIEIGLAVQLLLAPCDRGWLQLAHGDSLMVHEWMYARTVSSFHNLQSLKNEIEQHAKTQTWYLRMGVRSQAHAFHM
jgi:hypothetical protein